VRYYGRLGGRHLEKSYGSAKQTPRISRRCRPPSRCNVAQLFQFLPRLGDRLLVIEDRRFHRRKSEKNGPLYLNHGVAPQVAAEVQYSTEWDRGCARRYQVRQKPGVQTEAILRIVPNDTDRPENSSDRWHAAAQIVQRRHWGATGKTSEHSAVQRPMPRTWTSSALTASSPSRPSRDAQLPSTKWAARPANTRPCAWTGHKR